MQERPSRYVKVEVTQRNWDGQGNDRTFTYFPERVNLDVALARIRAAYNMDHTSVTVHA